MMQFLLSLWLSTAVQASLNLPDAARDGLIEFAGEGLLEIVEEDPDRYIGSPHILDLSTWDEAIDSDQTFEIGIRDVTLTLGVPDDVDWFSAYESRLTPVIGDEAQPTLSVSLGAAERWGLAIKGPPTDFSRDIGWFRSGYNDCLRSLREFRSFESMRRAIGSDEDVEAICDRLAERLEDTSDLDLALHALAADPFGFAGEAADPQDLEAFLWDWIGLCAAQAFHACRPFILIEGADTVILLWNRANRPETHPLFLFDIYDRETSDAIFDGYLSFSDDVPEEEVDYLRVVETLFERALIDDDRDNK